MGKTRKSDAALDDFANPTASTAILKSLPPKPTSFPSPNGDGFTPEEVHEALKPPPPEPWRPVIEYAEHDIGQVFPGPRPVTFTGRVVNIYDVRSINKAPKAARGCLKLCIKDETGMITVRLWYAARLPEVRLGSLLTVWASRVSEAETGTITNSDRALSASLFPERDRNCHVRIHSAENDNSTKRIALHEAHERHSLQGVMTLSSFLDGGFEVPDAKILVLVKSVGAMKQLTRKDGGTTQNVSVKLQDHTADATLGLWGTAALSPFSTRTETASMPPETMANTSAWRAGETVLLVQAPNYNSSRGPYITLTTTSIIEINPSIPDTHWLRNWYLRQKRKDSTNPLFPTSTFDSVSIILSSPIRCLYTFADLDSFARATPTATFQGFLSVLITEMKLVETWKRGMLLSGDCASCPNGNAIYANATTAKCSICGAWTALRLNPRILGRVIDETGVVETGKLLLSDDAWRDLLGNGPEELLLVGYEALKALADRLLFCRVTLIFGWTGDESVAGGRICVLAVRP